MKIVLLLHYSYFYLKMLVIIVSQFLTKIRFNDFWSDNFLYLVLLVGFASIRVLSLIASLLMIIYCCDLWFFYFHFRLINSRSTGFYYLSAQHIFMRTVITVSECKPVCLFPTNFRSYPQVVISLLVYFEVTCILRKNFFLIYIGWFWTVISQFIRRKENLDAFWKDPYAYWDRLGNARE